MKVSFDVTMITVGLGLAFWMGHLTGLRDGEEKGRWQGKDDTTVYCNLSPDYCKLQLDRMRERPVEPAIYTQLIGQ